MPEQKILKASSLVLAVILAFMASACDLLHGSGPNLPERIDLSSVARLARFGEDALRTYSGAEELASDL
ncbi:MAG: hypothetical protein Q8M76_08725, partial [Spirochaetaceae bacterium]|nr:hypothetical protein [Spirochaetaceae bacterium]